MPKNGLFMYLEHAVQTFEAIFSVFFFWQNFKDVRGDPVYRDKPNWKSRLNLVPCSASRNSIIIADKLMKFAGHLVMLVLIRGCGKNLISEQ